MTYFVNFLMKSSIKKSQPNILAKCRNFVGVSIDFKLILNSNIGSPRIELGNSFHFFVKYGKKYFWKVTPYLGW